MRPESLYCEELTIACSDRSIGSNDVSSMVDPVLINDKRVLNNMLLEEEEMGSRIIDYMANFQVELKPHMRKIVTDWMVEVCEDHQCSQEVFNLAVNYLDRFLSLIRIKKSQFQLVATICILLASKFCEAMPIGSEKLVQYTDNSVTLQELRDWELKILSILRWELSTVTAHSFLEHFLNSIPLDAKLNVNTIRRHAETLIVIAATEYKFLNVKPSVVAAASLAAACSGLSRSADATIAMDQVLSRKINQKSVLDVVCQIEAHIGTVPDMEAPMYEERKDGSRTPTDLAEISSALTAC